MVDLGEIRIRDPFLLVTPDGGYVLFGSTDADLWSGPGTGFDCWTSGDLRTWHGPVPAFRPPPGFWSPGQYWAPEVHRYAGRCFMFASFGGDGVVRGTQILVSDEPTGPYLPWSDGPVTPADWECLDGTLHVDQQREPWIVYCHEWAQVLDGEIVAQRLRQDLRVTAGPPILLFRASEAPWTRPLRPADGQPLPPGIDLADDCYISDGPFLHRTAEGALLMLWSSFGERGYALGLARSSSGTVKGPWEHRTVPLWADQGGHGMIARLPDGRLMLTLHHPNDTPDERTLLREVVEVPGGIELA
jgi:arabinan endo-1,5-alpha-L-arabinosidase